MSQISPTGSNWSRYDHETVISDVNAQVDHGRSAGANLEAAAVELIGTAATPLMLPAALLGFKVMNPSPTGMIGDRVDGWDEWKEQVKYGLIGTAGVVIMPALAVKDLADAAVHGIAAGWEKLFH